LLRAVPSTALPLTTGADMLLGALSPRGVLEHAIASAKVAPPLLDAEEMADGTYHILGMHHAPPPRGPSSLGRVASTLLVETAVPTAEPSVTPTLAPTVLPSMLPTHTPTDQPSAVPTDLPSAAPTVPSAAPTSEQDEAARESPASVDAASMTCTAHAQHAPDTGHHAACNDNITRLARILTSSDVRTSKEKLS
jgi:hypothetical protein